MRFVIINVSAFSFEQTLIIISREILLIIRGFTEKGIFMEKNNLREVLIMIAWALLVLALMVMNHRIIDPAYPEHIIGLSGLMEVRHYLVTYIFSTLGYVLLSFLFYIPVAVFAGLVPMLGMLMLPKTICYILMIIAFLKRVKTA